MSLELSCVFLCGGGGRKESTFQVPFVKDAISPPMYTLGIFVKKKNICEKRRHEFEEEYGGVFWKFEGTKGKREMRLKYNWKNHQKDTHELKELFFVKNHVSEILGSWVSIWVLSSTPLINVYLFIHNTRVSLLL